jgi:hypothetical protein
VLDLDTLILEKKAMNTPKNRQAVVELSAIREKLHTISGIKYGCGYGGAFRRKRSLPSGLPMPALQALISKPKEGYN